MSTHPSDTSTGASPSQAPQEYTLCDPPPLAAPRSQADRIMRRLLFLPTNGPKATAAEAQKAFQTSVVVAGVRCLIMYILLPFVLPAVGIAAGVGPWIGLPIAIAAIVAVTMSIRRFWRADHSKRWHYTVIGAVVIGFMIYEGTKDIIEIVS